MQESGSQNEQSTMPEEPEHHPKPTRQQRTEGPIETPGPNPTPKDGNVIPPTK